MYEGDEINSFDGNGTFDRPGAIMSSSPDEQQNAAPVKTPKPPKTDDVPAPNFFGEPTIQAAPVERAPRRINARPFIIGGIALVAITLIIVVASLIAKGGTSAKDGIDSAVAGMYNINAIFDKNAPIPYRSGRVGEYGYVDPSSFKLVIPRQFQEAGPFYGNYAAATKAGKKVIINRKGEILVERSAETVIKYVVSENYWEVGDDIFNGEMKKINDNDTRAEYKGYGYAYVIPQEKDKKGGISPGVPYLVKIETGEKVFECSKEGCAIIITSGVTDENVYMAVHEMSANTRIINLANNQEVHKISSENVVAKIADGIFSEKSKATGEVVRYISVDNGSSKTSSSSPKINSDNSISHAGGFFVESCGSKGYKISSNNNVAIECGIEAYWELSESTYLAMAKDKKYPILIQKTDGVHLVDIGENKDTKVYDKAGEVEVFDNSAFIKMTADGSKKQICNVLEPKATCIVVKKGAQVEAHGTYIIVDGITYSYNLKEVSYEE